ncbi:MAG: zf-HC2 domain-containing protein [Candidatus Gastranaerophilales bacterium]|nr:zf-HC2 domain-containing protein [Candidatus Gastranaerophilales bacterium]
MAKSDCDKFLKMLPAYIEGKISSEQIIEIEKHLSVCSSCFEKYINLKNISQKIKNSFENIKQEKFISDKDSFFNENLSAYIDNELSNEEYLFFNGYVALNPEKRKELDEMLYFEEKLKESLEKNRQILQKDLSKKIVRQIRLENPACVSEMYVTASIATIILVLLTITAAYFSIPDNLHNFAVKAHLIKEIKH